MTTAVPSSRILTVPNGLSFARLCCVPVFLWLVLADHHDRAGLILLMVASSTDFFDGALARKLNQVTRLGQVLDPLADRVYIAATAVALCGRGLCPWWVLGLLAGRDLVLSATLPILKKHGYAPLAVSRIGKAATLNLLYAFPFLLLTAGHDHLAKVGRALGWAFGIWGCALYLLSGAGYVIQTSRLTRRPAALDAADEGS